MGIEKDRKAARKRRHAHVRKHVEGRPERPRLCVTKTCKHIYAQVIDDWAGRTLAMACTLDKGVREQLNGASAKSCDAARVVGRVLAERAKAAGITAVVFDRGGWPYHGRVKALAEGAREGGLEF
ncbi:MAG: 50S ribosomal protein L18 [Armatimonadetes bacterium]|nr:50S ribosomal protein L18 [Armatimonadota bacterium]